MKELLLSVFEISISTSLVILALLLFSRLLNKRYVAKWKYFIWIALALRLAVPVKLELPKLPVIQQQEIVFEMPARIAAPILPTVTLPTAQRVEVRPTVTPLDVLAVIWLVGCIAFLLIHIGSYLRYRRRVVLHGERVRDLEILTMVRALSKDLGLPGGIPIRTYAGATSPMVLGFFRPILVLPAMDFRSEELRFILRHELIHLKRHDIFFKFLFVAANAVHWFNPIVYLMQKEAVLDMELSCDETVVENSGYDNRKAYTETLLATLCRQQMMSTNLSTQFYGGKQVMKRRFKNILGRATKKNGVVVLVLTVSAVLILGTIIGCTVAKANKEAPTQPQTEAMETVPETEAAATSGRPTSAELEFYPEGMLEKCPVTLYEGKGYSIYITDGDWSLQQTENEFYRTDLWTAVVNENVTFEVRFYPGVTENDIKTSVTPATIAQNEGGYWEMYRQFEIQGIAMCESIRLYVAGDGVYGVFMNYPLEAAEGFGTRMYTMAGSIGFGRVATAEDNREAAPEFFNKLTDAEKAELEIINEVAAKFANAYFSGDMETVQSLRLNPARDWPKYHGPDFDYQKAIDAGFLYSSDIIQYSMFNANVISPYDDLTELYTTLTVMLNLKGTGAPEEYEYFVIELSKQEEGWLSRDFGFGRVATAEDNRELARLTEEFADAYFAGDAAALKAYMAEEPSQYSDDGAFLGELLDIHSTKGVPQAGGTLIMEDGVTTSVEFHEAESPDSYTYLTIEFIQENGQWKIDFYGLEK